MADFVVILSLAMFNIEEDDPIKAQNMKTRSTLLSAVTGKIASSSMNQTQVAELLDITQPRVSVLVYGKIDKFRLDTLIKFAHKLGHRARPRRGFSTGL